MVWLTLVIKSISTFNPFFLINFEDIDKKLESTIGKSLKKEIYQIVRVKNK
jgi:hypothetical protein